VPETYSVLMSVYAAERPEWLLQSLRSMFAQTLPPGEVVLVCDGPLTPPLEQAAADAAAGAPCPLRLLRLERNCGLGEALRRGLPACQNEFVARMDTDDLARPDRCRLQLRAMEERGLDLCSGTVAEFAGDPARPLCLRSLPLEHDRLVEYAQSRNPMNHPAVMLRKSAALAAGGYRPAQLFEDYDLWLRMIRAGARLGNLQETLVDMRVNPDFYARRGGWSYWKAVRRFWLEAGRQGFVTRGRCARNLCIRFAACMMPGPLRQRLYRRGLRSKLPARP